MLGRGLGRQLHEEPEAGGLDLVRVDGAAHRVRELAHDEQADPRPGRAPLALAPER